MTAISFVTTPVGFQNRRRISDDSLCPKHLKSTRSIPSNRTIHMQLPPPGFLQHIPPPTEDQLLRTGQSVDPEYPGTLSPGGPDCYPLEEVMKSGVLERMEYVERDRDERPNHVFELEVDLLEWLAEQGRLLPRGAVEDEWDKETRRVGGNLVDFDFRAHDDDDSRDDDDNNDNDDAMLSQIIAAEKGESVKMDDEFDDMTSFGMDADFVE